MKKYLAGIRVTKKITIGHYLGFIKPIIDLAKDKNNDIILLCCDLYDEGAYKFRDCFDQLKEIFKKIDNVKVVQQSKYSDFLFLATNCLEKLVKVSELSRMTQYKDKVARGYEPTISLLTYPLLMTADIMYFDCDFIVIGDDQKQHIEYARDFIARFNKKHEVNYKLPKEFSTNLVRIKDLQNPEIKMSKSSENKNGVLFLDKNDDYKKKIMKAVSSEAGIDNLCNIYNLLSGENVDPSFYYANALAIKKMVINKVESFLVKL